MKEEKIKQQQAEAVNQSSKNTPTMPSGTILIPPPQCLEAVFLCPHRLCHHLYQFQKL
ncbi:putative transport protein sec7 [Rickettsia amblyommatis str. Darkwater]|uniref:Putative transport protein sec7 n=1 Tax=Rickettsia amblyommatis str. Ac/Pa TaxID=1359164 RepID=A0A0F3N504_RICAM|nr:putative transport protein sec7 [Rickettsia amblyommatis str. Ac/Pa]KJV95072.1 putative transport protein sec7 [Rickettsia amblyommatis str. Darkwater]